LRWSFARAPSATFGPTPVDISSAHGRLVNAIADRRCTNQTDHYMISMTNTRSDSVLSIAEWKAKHQPDQRRVPVYVPVCDPAGRWRLELTGTTTIEPELHFYVDPS